MLEYVNNILKNQPKTVLTSLIVLLIILFTTSIPLIWNYAKKCRAKEVKNQNIEKAVTVTLPNMIIDLTEQVEETNINQVKGDNDVIDLVNESMGIIVSQLAISKETKNLVEKAIKINPVEKRLKVDTVISIKINKIGYETSSDTSGECSDFTKNNNIYTTGSNSNGSNSNRNLIYSPVFDLFDKENNESLKETDKPLKQNIFKKIKNIFK